MDKAPKLWIKLIVGLYLLLALGYGLANPIFEAPDEHHHYFTVRHIALTGELATPDKSPLARQEAAQPPLYYLLGAGLLTLLDLPVEPMPLWLNPHLQFSNSTTTQNINVFVHSKAEGWPWQGDVLAVHLLRLYTSLLGLGTLLLIYASARLIWPKQPYFALLSLGLIAFLPQFLFLHSAVSNDGLIILLSTAVLYQLLLLWKTAVSWLRLVGLGVTIGLAILAKMTGLALLPFACGVVFLLLWRDGRLPQLIPACLLVSGLAIAVSGWLLWRNWTLYGDITAVNQFVELAGGVRSYTLRQVWHDMARVWRSLIAYFGWMTLRMPAWLYTIWVGFAMLSLAGWLWQSRTWRNKWTSWKHFLQQPLLWLSGWWLIVVVAWLRFMLQTPADQGRLWFPAILPMVLLLAYGLMQWHSRWLARGVLGLALGTAVFSLHTIQQVYAQPTILPSNTTLDATVFNAPLGNGLTLIAANIVQEMIHPAEPIDIKLYWQVENTPETVPVLEIEALGRGYKSVGLLQSYHGRGQYPASLWAAGAGITADSATLTLSPNMTTPTLVRLLVRLQDGNESVEIGQIKVREATNESLEPLAQLGNSLALIQAKATMTKAKPGESITIHLGWQAEAKQERPLTAFVHMGEAGEQPVAQIDRPPLAQDYPLQVWEAGDVVYDGFVLTLPEGLANGRYPLYTGLYDSETIERLPLTIRHERQPTDAYLLGFIEIQ